MSAQAANDKMQAAYRLLSDAVDDVRGNGSHTREAIRAAQTTLSLAISLNRPEEGL